MSLGVIDPSNAVVALCAAGMAVEGTPAEARRLFEQAWAARRDDHDAAIAAHFLARHQPTPADTLHWNAVAVRHAELVPDGRAAELMASLWLNLGDSQATAGNVTAAARSAERAERALEQLPAGGYRDLVATGIRRLAERVRAAADQGKPSTDASSAPSAPGRP